MRLAYSVSALAMRFLPLVTSFLLPTGTQSFEDAHISEFAFPSLVSRTLVCFSPTIKRSALPLLFSAPKRDSGCACKTLQILKSHTDLQPRLEQHLQAFEVEIWLLKSLATPGSRVSAVTCSVNPTDFESIKHGYKACDCS